MSHHFRGRFCWSGLLAALLPAAQVLGLSVTGVTPADYQVAALGQGSTCYTDAGPTIASIPPALAGGTLIRTKAGDAANPSLAVSFQVDVRAEVYVCCDSGAAPPSWLSSWVHTDMTVAVSGGAVSSYSVYAKRFGAGAVQLSQNQAGAMYFVVPSTMDVCPLMEAATPKSVIFAFSPSPMMMLPGLMSRWTMPAW